MADYISNYTGSEIDAGIAKANTAIQPVEGKGLSTNDYTDADKTKLSGIDMSTKQDVIDSSHKLSADLISDGSTNKTVTATEKSTWSGKQDTLVSGTNIKTINNTSILGSGNITIEGGGATEVYVGDTQPSDASILLWVDTSSSPTPPTPSTDPVTNLAGTTTSNSATLTWTASSNATSYKVYNGDTLVDTTSNTSYTINGLTASTQYTFGVVATGTAGDSTKVTVTVTTQQSGGGDLPAEYQEVEYVIDRKSGTTVGVCSGLQNKDITKIEMGVETDFSQYQMLTLSGNQDGTNRGAPYIFNTVNKVAMQGYPTGTYVTSVTPDSSTYVGLNTKVDFTFNISSSDEKYLFLLTADPEAWKGADRNIYYARVYGANDTLLRNYVPCYRKSDNKVGMYDLVNSEFALPILGDWGKGGDV